MDATQKFNLHSPESRAKALASKNSHLTLRQKKFIKEYLENGNGAAAVRAAFNVKNAATYAFQLLRKPKIKKTIDEALAKAGLTDDFSTGVLKSLIDNGQSNLSLTKPADVLKALEMFWRLSGRLGTERRNIEKNLEEQAQQMSTTDLVKAIKDLDKRQARLFAALKGSAQEGEVVDEKT